MAGDSGGAVWYATEDRIRGWGKFSWYDDRGSIKASEGRVQFFGRKGALDVRRVAGVRLVGPTVPCAALAWLALGNVVVLLMAGAGGFNYLTLENPMTYAVLAL